MFSHTNEWNGVLMKWKWAVFSSNFFSMHFESSQSPLYLAFVWNCNLFYYLLKEKLDNQVFTGCQMNIMSKRQANHTWWTRHSLLLFQTKTELTQYWYLCYINIQFQSINMLWKVNWYKTDTWILKCGYFPFERDKSEPP